MADDPRAASHASKATAAEDDLLPRIERTPLIETVIARLRDLASSDQYGPGSKLPSERELRDRLGVGRSTIREALRALEALGIIELRQGKGAFVVDRRRPPRSDFAAWGETHEWDIQSILEARIALEVHAAGLAAVRRTDDAIDRLAEQLSAFNAAMESDDLPALVLADATFHDLIAEAANPVLASFLQSMAVMGIESRQTSLGRPERRPQVLQRHRAIYDAVVKRDCSAAAEAMRVHLYEFGRELGIALPHFAGRADGRSRKEHL